MSESNTDPSLYRSTDLGDSWQAIDFPEKTASDSEENAGFTFATGAGTQQVDDNSETEKTASVKMVAAQERLLVVDGSESYYSSDAGETWVSLGPGAATIGSATTRVIAAATGGDSTAVIADANTFYKSSSPLGIQRTTDAGKTWHPFNTGLVRTGVDKLVYANNMLYAKTWGELVVSFDDGESWTPVLRCPEILTSMMKFNDVPYVKGVEGGSPQLFRVSAEDNGLVPVPGMPILGG